MKTPIALTLVSLLATSLASEASAKGFRFSVGKAAAVAGARAAVKATRDKPAGAEAAAPAQAAPVLSPRLEAPTATALAAGASGAPAGPDVRTSCAARQGRMVGATSGGFCVLN